MEAAAACCTDLSELLPVKLFKALCDANRVAILALLARRCEPCTVSQIAQCCPINISVVSRHLALLRDAGILAARKQGKHVFYTVRYEEVVALLRRMADGIEACCVKNPNGG